MGEIKTTPVYDYSAALEDGAPPLLRGITEKKISIHHE